MTINQPASGTDAGLPEGTLDRLAKFAEWTNTTPPARIVDDEDVLTQEFKAYARDNGLSLDWVFFDDPVVTPRINAKALENLLNSIKELRASLLTTLGAHEYIVIKDEELRRVFDAAKAMYGEAAQ